MWKEAHTSACYLTVMPRVPGLIPGRNTIFLTMDNLCFWFWFFCTATQVLENNKKTDSKDEILKSWMITSLTFKLHLGCLFQIAKSSLDNSLLKYSAKEYMFRAALCHLCVDILNAQHALDKYSALYPAFGDTRECKLVRVSTSSSFQLLKLHCWT